MYYHTPGANHFRPTVGGVYAIEASLIIDYSVGGPNDFVEMIVVKNGALPGVKRSITRVNAGDKVSLSISSTMHLNAGDVIHIEVANQSGGNQFIPAGEDSWFSGHIIYED